jgi:voltage-gated potassium channel
VSVTEKFKPHKHMFRYSAHLIRALATPGIVYITITGNIMLFSCAALFYWFEHPVNPLVRVPFDAIWWAFTTVTTVGYGDVVPSTLAGRGVSIVLMVTGAALFFGFTAILITAFSSLTSEEVKKSEQLTKAEYEDIAARLEQISGRLTRLEDHLRSKD